MIATMKMQLILAGCLVTLARGYVVYRDGYFYSSPYGIPALAFPAFHERAPLAAPLAVLPGAPLQTAVKSTIPLLTIPSRHLPLIPRPHINSVSSHTPYLNCQQNGHFIEAMPAVRVVLNRPLVFSGPESSVAFPSQLETIYEGVRYSIPVAALLAPTSEPAFGQHVLRVVYAVPDLPIAHNHHYLPILPPRTRPASSVEQKPQVTVLNFPEELASPPVTSYQPEGDDELLDRGPPQAVAPAGIVQSAQPSVSNQAFENSKESAHLKGLKDQANKHRDYKPGVEAL